MSRFVYSRFPASANVSTESEGGHRNCDTNMKIYYHRVGTSQAQDVALFALPDEASRMMQAQVSQGRGREGLSCAHECA